MVESNNFSTLFPPSIRKKVLAAITVTTKTILTKEDTKTDNKNFVATFKYVFLKTDSFIEFNHYLELYKNQFSFHIKKNDSIIL